MNNFYTDEVCSICCRSHLLMIGIVHKVTDMDGYTWNICDDCWKMLKEVMDKEDEIS